MPVYLGAVEIEALELGTTDIANVYLGTTQVWPPAAPPPTLEVIDADFASYTSSQSPSITFSTSPVEDDVICVFVACINAFVPNTVTGWTQSIPGGVVTVGSAMSLYAAYHVVTAAEDSANTVTWTLTTLIPTARSGAVVGAIVRGVYTAFVVDAYGTNSHATAVTPHNLAAVTGTDITNSGGLVLRAIARDGPNAYTTNPAGHDVLTATGTTQALWLGALDTPATAGVNIATASITPSTADEGAAITLVLTPA